MLARRFAPWAGPRTGERWTGKISFFTIVVVGFTYCWVHLGLKHLCFMSWKKMSNFWIKSPRIFKTDTDKASPESLLITKYHCFLRLCKSLLKLKYHWVLRLRTSLLNNKDSFCTLEYCEVLPKSLKFITITDSLRLHNNLRNNKESFCTLERV